MSKKIKSLEAELGEELFKRKGNNVVSLSPFGEYISNFIHNIIEDYEILLDTTAQYKHNHTQILKVCTFLNVAHSGLLKPLTAFERKKKNFYIETKETNHTTLKQSLSMHEPDICFCYRELVGEFSDYDVIPLFQDPLLLIASNDHADEMGWKSSINLSSIKNERFCFPREDMEIFAFLISVCRTCGFTPKLTNSDVRLGTIRKYISDGMRCTLQFASISKSKFYENNFAFINLENGPKLTMSMYINKSSKSKYIDDFIAVIKQYYNLI